MWLHSLKVAQLLRIAACLHTNQSPSYLNHLVFGFVGTDHLRTKIIINDETLEQVNQLTYLGCSITYQFSNDVESKMAKFLQIIGTIKRNIFRKVRTETILKIYNTLIVPAFLYGSENWTLTASQRRRIEAQK